MDMGMTMAENSADQNAALVKQASEGRRTLSIMKACEMAQVSRRTIYNWIAAGKVETVRTASGSIRVFADSIFKANDNTPKVEQPIPTPKRGTRGNEAWQALGPNR